MKIKSLEILDFRGIPKLTLDFPNQVTVLIGINGSGKSAVLDCMAVMLSRLVGRIRLSKGTGRFFSVSDVSNGKSETVNTIKVAFKGMQTKPVEWTVYRRRRGRRKQTISNLSELNEIVDSFHNKLESNINTNLPLAVYYPVHRAVLDIPLRIRKKHPFDQLAAYDRALSREASNFRIFFEWFREREDLENERRLKSSKYRDPQLQSVREAIQQFLPEFRELRVKRSPLRMVVEKNEKELVINQLSDGEKCTLAMVGDLARRMAIANPSMKNPLQGKGVVLIDEIDLHLHPSWQREIVAGLKKTFPECQFILSTHSPQILSHLDSNSIWKLIRTKKGVTAKRPRDAYGLESGRILEDLMEVSARPQEIKGKFSALFRAIEQGNTKKAERLIEKLRDAIGEDPDLVKADVLIHRKKILEK